MPTLRLGLEISLDASALVSFKLSLIVKTFEALEFNVFRFELMRDLLEPFLFLFL